MEVRLPREDDRDLFVEFFCDEAFMVFSRTLTRDAAHARFNSMLVNAEEVPFAKQPVVERSSGLIVGYAGVDRFDMDGEEWLEFGWRLVPQARGSGYATEASRAVLATAAWCFSGELLALIDPVNEPSQRVAVKLGFQFWKRAVLDEGVRNLYRLQVG